MSPRFPASAQSIEKALAALQTRGWVRAQSKGTIPVLTWGGLRGCISVALALSLLVNGSRSLALTLTSFVVVFSILVPGLTVARVIRIAGGLTAGPALAASIGDNGSLSIVKSA